MPADEFGRSDPAWNTDAFRVDVQEAVARFSHSQDLLLVAAPGGTVAAVNPAWTESSGWTAEEMLHRPWAEMLIAEDVKALAEKLADGRVARQTFRIPSKHGPARRAEGSARRNASGAIICVMRDVTDDVASDIDIQDARDAHHLMTLAGLSTWKWTPGEGLAISPEGAAMFGLDPAKPPSVKALFALTHPDDVESLRTLLQIATREGRSGAVEVRTRGAEEGWLHIRIVYKTEPHPSGGCALHGLTQDITELARARDAALHSEQRVRALMDDARVAARRLKLALAAAQAGVFEIDHKLGAFWCSPEFVMLIGRGLTYEESRHMPWDFVYPDDQHLVLEASQIWRTGTTLNEPLDVRIIRPDGAVRWMRLYYELRRDTHGRALRSVGLVLDIDERKRQELALVEAERAAQAGAHAKSRFLASVSHEIRTPMNGILGVLHLLRAETLSTDGRKLIDEALGCGKMLSELLNDVLDFSKIEANELELSPEPTNPAQVLTGVVSLLRSQAEARGLSLKIEAADAGWAQLDGVRLRQALFNLIGNAVKFTLNGGVTVRLWILDDPARIRFEIKDTGVGIASSARAGLFERFHQADSSTTRRFGGTGLGLAITKRLAQMMGGDVGFDSVEGEGSTFWFEAAAPPAAASDVCAEEDGVGLDGLSVLVVEDNSTNRLIARKLLESLGARVDEAVDGEAGVEQAREGRFDVILMDVQMPKMDGLEATRHIRTLELGGPRTPIIALTANVLSHQKLSYTEAGMDGVVAKPISPQALLNEINRLVGPSAQGQASTGQAA